MSTHVKWFQYLVLRFVSPPIHCKVKDRTLDRVGSRRVSRLKSWAHTNRLSNCDKLYISAESHLVVPHRVNTKVAKVHRNLYAI